MTRTGTADPTHYDGQDLEALADLPNYTGWILQRFRPFLHGRVIEVGAGLGNVARRYVDQVGEALLVEPAANLFAKLQAEMAARPHVKCAQGVLEQVPQELLAQPFDAALMVNVLEHIPDDAAALQQVRAVLKPGGHLLIFVPALPLLYGSLDELVHHCRRYRRGELQAKLVQAGFVVEECRYFDVLGIAPWLVAGRVLRQRRFDARGAALYDRLGVPVTRALESKLAVPFGKSLIAVARVPAEGGA